MTPVKAIEELRKNYEIEEDKPAKKRTYKHNRKTGKSKQKESSGCKAKRKGAAADDSNKSRRKKRVIQIDDTVVEDYDVEESASIYTIVDKQKQ